MKIAQNHVPLKHLYSHHQLDATIIHVHNHSFNLNVVMGQRGFQQMAVFPNRMSYMVTITGATLSKGSEG